MAERLGEFSPARPSTKHPCASALAVLLALFMVATPILPFYDGPIDEVSAAHLSDWTRVFHLHDGATYATGEYDWMNSSGVANPAYSDYDGDGRQGITIKKNTPAMKWHHWFLYPGVGSTLTLTGEMTAYVWLASLGNASGTLVTASFEDMPPGQYGNAAAWTTISSTTIPLNGPFYSQWQEYTFTMTIAPYTLQPGHFLVLTIQRGDSLNDMLLVWYDKTDYDSYVTIDTSTPMDIGSAWLQDCYGNPRSVYSDQESPAAVCNVSNPFGAYEIMGATASVAFAGNGTIVNGSVAMSVLRTDASATPYWREYILALPTLKSGSYVVNMTASDPQGSPAWSVVPYSVVSVDHFSVDAPAAVEAGSNFTLALDALDLSNVTVDGWVGTVQLEAFKTDRSSAASGNLSVRFVVFNPADAGKKTIPNETYSAGEETIAIKATSGDAVGWSENLTVSSGRVSHIDITLTPGAGTYAAGATVSVEATGRDCLGNVNLTWNPVWSATPSIGVITGTGFTVSFEATSIGYGNITCVDEFSGTEGREWITIQAGLLDQIVITPGSNPDQVYEGDTLLLTAVGYDELGNVVNLTGATWDTSTSGSISGTGGSATFTSSMIPEQGEIRCRKGGVTGTLSVTILNALDGPWIYPPIPAQIRNEDSGSWEVSLTGHWNDIFGTSNLTWWADGVNTSLFLISHDASSNAIIRFYTQPNEWGDGSLELWVADPEGHRARQTIFVSIKPVNDPPEFVNSVPEQLYVKFDTPYTFDYVYYVSDIDNDKSELSLSSDVSGVYFNGLVATFMFPTKKGLDEYFEIVTLTLSDGQSTDALKIVVWVTKDTPPVLSQDLPDDLTIWEGDLNIFVFNLSDYFADPDGDYLVYSRGFFNVDVDIRSNNSVYLSAPNEWSGTEQGTFTATDVKGALKTDTINITVLPVNDAPRILRNDQSVFVKYDTFYYLYLSPIVFDPDNSLESLIFNISDSHVQVGYGPTGAQCLRLYYPGNLSGGPFTDPYVVDVWVNVSDVEGAEAPPWRFSVRVTENEPPSIIAPNPDELFYSFPEDTWLNNSLRMDELFYDDPNDTMTFYLSGPLHIYARVFPGGAINLTADVNWSGAEVFNITAMDTKGGWAFLQVYIAVTPVNDAPVIYPIHDFINRGHQFRTAHYPISQFIYDSDNPYSELTITPSPDAYFTIVGTDLFVSLPEGVNVVTVTIEAIDGELSSNSVSFKVGVEGTTAERIGWPYSFPLVLLGVGVVAFFLASRIPRPYALENIFLIHNDGRLVAHVTKEENTTLDKDVVSAMFTAVQEFVRDSFQKGEVGLKKLEIGDKNVMIEKGNFVYLALIYSGWPTKETFQMLPMLVRDVEERYKERIAKWNGTMKTVRGVDKMLQEYMAANYQPGVWHDEEELADKEWVDILTKEA